MSDPAIDALADSARFRGLKLVRSRVRKEGKPGFGKVGLTDAKGTAVFGLADGSPSATPDDVADYLRNMGAQDWGASLDVAEPLRKSKPKKAAARDHGSPATPRHAPRPPKPRPEPKLTIRDARPADAAALSDLMQLLNHDIDEKMARTNVARLARLGEAPLVAALDKKVIGLCGLHIMHAIHRDAPVGRINILVVAKDLRGKGIGRKLVEECEVRLREAGCKIIEVTSNDRLGPAHAFYRHMGYERTSIRFAKSP
ncbi:GNAT family N-acetyltransferase [Sphingomonas lutea]|uniref:GNAT family N-acetyltransferase n=1 Tax=Sphingomonas lutea TaxID=1045317 RepID=A0A7G9SHP7_9SPHN|nr:GNAT family N-acetyltransferase [Sphingomonas lutea]QNN67372.1 GNAT family N-acetyltransferase [Sphingomonas lutea]